MASSKRKRGFVLIAMSITILLLLAILGLAFDLGRIYIAHNEAQIFTDAAAMAAAKKLDGTAEGQKLARGEVAKLPMRWDLGTKIFSGVVVEFPPDGRTVRVSAPVNEVEITFLRAIGGPNTFTVPARSVAAANPVRLVE